MPKQELYIFLLVILAAVGMFTVIEPHNLGFTPDSMAYLEMAENFSAGRGITNDNGEVIDHWPPAFPIAISLTAGISEFEIMEAGKILQPFLFFFFVLLFFMILKQLQLGSTTILFSVLLLITSQLVKTFLAFLSEGLFLTLLLLSFHWFLKWLHEKKGRFLIFTGITCGFLFLTRYAAVAFIGTYILFLLITNKSKFKQCCREVLYLVVPILLIVIPWFLYLIGFDENPEGRKMAVHFISLSKLGDLFVTIAFWFLGSTMARIALFSLVLLYGYYLFKRKFPLIIMSWKSFMNYRKTFLVLFLMISVYPLFLIISISFYDSWTPLDNRILSPIFPFVLLLIAFFLDSLYKQRRKILYFSTVYVLLFSFTSSVVPSYISFYQNGGGYNKVQWSESELISFLKNHPSNLPVYSNGVELAVLHIGQDFKLLPLNSRDLEIKELAHQVNEGKAQIVYFNNVNWRNYLIKREKLLDKFEGLEKVFFEDGFIIRKATSE